MTRYKPLKIQQWREYGAQAREIKRLLHELKNINIPVKIREPHLISAWRNLSSFCSKAESEMLKQHPDIENPSQVFRGGIYNWD